MVMYMVWWPIPQYSWQSSEYWPASSKVTSISDTCPGMTITLALVSGMRMPWITSRDTALMVSSVPVGMVMSCGVHCQAWPMRTSSPVPSPVSW